jgi:hypothetical protein
VAIERSPSIQKVLKSKRQTRCKFRAGTTEVGCEFAAKTGCNPLQSFQAMGRRSIVANRLVTATSASAWQGLPADGEPFAQATDAAVQAA